MKKQVAPTLIDDNDLLPFEEFCRLLSIDQALLVEMVEFGILEPYGESISSWQFSYVSLRRAKQAQRLAQDLHINLSGIALSLDLLDQLKHLRAQLEALEHQLKLSGQA